MDLEPPVYFFPCALSVASDYLSHSSTFDSKAPQHHPIYQHVHLLLYLDYQNTYTLMSCGPTVLISLTVGWIPMISIRPQLSFGVQVVSLNYIRRESVDHSLVKVIPKSCCIGYEGCSTKPDWGLVQKRLICGSVVPVPLLMTFVISST
jgi:hypothetical protein